MDEAGARDQAVISLDVLARYAGEAASEVEGVQSLVASRLHRHRGVVVTAEDGLAVELHVAVPFGAPIAALGDALQVRVAEYLAAMADAEPARVDVVVERVGPPGS
ncbi:MAG: Asp23/Gls24 family envelope stress response protein [Gaiellaceae bacterium]